MLGKKQKRGSRAFRGCAEAKPGGKRDARGELRIDAAEIQHQGAKPSAMHQQVGRAECLIQPGPGLLWSGEGLVSQWRFRCRTRGRCGRLTLPLIARQVRRHGVRAADQTLSARLAPRRDYGWERLACQSADDVAVRICARAGCRRLVIAPGPRRVGEGLPPDWSGLAPFGCELFGAGVTELEEGSGSSPREPPQRTHSRRLRSIPFPAADSGSKLSEASIQAQTWPARMTWAIKALAQVSRPLDVLPTSSVMAPTGRPPSSRASSWGMPLEIVGSSTFACGEKAEGMRCSSEDSRAERSWAARDIRLMFA